MVMNFTMKLRRDGKIKACFMTATYMNYEDARRIFPSLEIECYIQKPVEISDLVGNVNAELGL
jgi:response regulator RpfG family c-di-GMP phosphodiesterase